MLRKLLQGLIFGAGFSIAFVVVYTVWITWALPTYLNQKLGDGKSSRISLDAEKTEAPPPVQAERKFRGTQLAYSTDFSIDRYNVLAAGAGNIVGKITAAGQPVTGLRIRLALNGSVMSQWGATGSDGLYSVAVPFGQYRVDGYQIDERTANEVLPNYIDNPHNPHSVSLFEVGPGKNGEGVSLDYVVPVAKLGPHGEVSLSKEVIVSWEPYPGAASYIIQVYENDDPYDYVGGHAIFKWPERPRVSESSINLTALRAPLKPDHYYTAEIVAEDAAGHFISQTPRQYNKRDFKAVGGK